MSSSSGIASSCDAIPGKKSKGKRKLGENGTILRKRGDRSRELEDGSGGGEAGGISRGVDGVSWCQYRESSDWGEYTEAQLENLVLESIKVTIETGVRKLVAMGYSAEEATDAIVTSGNYVRFSGTIEIAEGHLKKGGGGGGRKKVPAGEFSVEEFERLALAKMIGAVRSDRPSLSRPDALWCLLVSDLDVVAAIKDLESIDNALSSSSSHPESPHLSSTPQRPTCDFSSDDEDELDMNEELRTECLSACTELSPALTADPRYLELKPVTSESDIPRGIDVVNRLFESLDSKSKAIKELEEKVTDLDRQLEERTEWARAKVLQAAQRLSKDINELKKLRAEREEAFRASESNKKKYLELESSFQKLTSQLDQAKVGFQKVEAVNAELRAELEATKLSASESFESSVKASKQERKLLKTAQNWEKQRAKLQEELSTERRKLSKLQEQMAQTKEIQHQAEDRSRQDKKAKDEALFRLEAEKLAREKAEAAAKQRVERIQRKSEADLRAHRDEIHKLEQEVCKLKFGASELSLLDLSEQDAVPMAWGVRRDRECVMCLCEEISVVFLPCAHQVVCVKCNDLHERKGMAECPSCRTRIQQRVRVYNGAN
ncbi:hypothetical protein SELMODRAFT_408316 [Selaginella moellendorffii]|uniref:RING-type domain-containing protein n=1 Tax=Selaginella moellendorffii TaxID=88036 RepID=D8R7W9_SELML|nr:MND1-interacting protein 1 [Selaginella moellendorffii]EFJ31603.1 hypothetical protein SELMODRAFT_408316 [Selaginella moellendorffii]|eukprot:XP_002967004.1 MND1-interacting protein 1 [Selaginella moellendorffii]